ncbi:phosphatase PAP2 family protein [Microbacterium phyllosphaerae]|uniref:phosphatase PAP2 family protein n=1 Tax=Microbacterium phyllosphaerae TaxID=124798 RepID=UPI000EA1193F|nr:phosphatase PAP2 family protein [Microbacterium phyllosphaerae]
MRRRTLLWWGIGMLVAATLLGAAIVFGYTEPPGFDTWWNQTISTYRAEWMLSFALILNDIGGGWVAIILVPLLMIIALLLARRWRAAVFAAVAFLASAGAVQLLKQLFGRARPEDMIVVSDYGSFPSGHTANAATIAVVLWLVFPRVWTAILGILWVLAMAISRTLLSVHWATDTLGGALVGAGVVLVLGSVMLPWVQSASRRAAVPAPIG